MSSKMSSKKIQKCMDEKVLDEFNLICNGTFSPPIIQNKACLGNGKKIAEKLADKINTECPDLHASYSSSYYDINSYNNEWRFNIKEKPSNYQTYPDEETLSLLE